MCQAYGLEKSAVALTFNIMMITFCIGAVIGAQIEKRIGLRTTLFASAALFFAGFAGTATFANRSIESVYVFYGVLGGLGVGIGYNSIIATTNVWFPDKVGFSSGVLMMGFGLGSLILGNISINLVPLFGLSNVFSAIGVATVLVVASLAMTLSYPPSNIVTIMAPEKACGNNSDDPADNDNILKTPTFYVYCIWAVVVIAIGLATIGNCASDAQLVGFDVGFATLLVGLVSTCNGLARVIIGALYDKTNVKITQILAGLPLENASPRTRCYLSCSSRCRRKEKPPPRRSRKGSSEQFVVATGAIEKGDAVI